MHDNINFSWYFKYYSSLKRRKGKVLDVGCGVGKVVNRIKDDRTVVSIGIDISQLGIRMAIKNGNGTFIIGDFLNLPFRNDCFDSVGCYNCLEHGHQPNLCLREMIRVLKPLGKIVVSSPNFLTDVICVHHWNLSIFVNVIRKLRNYLEKVIISKLTPEKMKFEFLKHREFKVSSLIEFDMDAVCATNPIDIKFNLLKLGVKVIYESACSTYQKSIIEKISIAPLFRNLGPSAFIIGVKMVNACYE